MTLGSFAEQILSIAMPPDRAASTVGDLFESSPQPLIFWRAVFRTFVGAALGQMSIRTAVKALALVILFRVIVDFAINGAFSWNQRNFPVVTMYFGSMWRIMTSLGIPLIAARLVAGRMPGREMAAFITYFLVMPLVIVVVMHNGLVYYTHSLYFLINPFGLSSTFLASLLARRKSLKKISQKPALS